MDESIPTVIVESVVDVISALASVALSRVQRKREEENSLANAERRTDAVSPPTLSGRVNDRSFVSKA